MALPLPTQLMPKLTPLASEPTPLHTRPYRFFVPRGWVEPMVQNYLSGGATWVGGTVFAPARPVDQPGANYFTPLAITSVWDVVFLWSDLHSFFWWPELVETTLALQDRPSYFPAAERIQIQPSEPDAERIPNPTMK